MILPSPTWTVIFPGWPPGFWSHIFFITAIRVKFWKCRSDHVIPSVALLCTQISSQPLCVQQGLPFTLFHLGLTSHSPPASSFTILPRHYVPAIPSSQSSSDSPPLFHGLILSEFPPCNVGLSLCLLACWPLPPLTTRFNCHLLHEAFL